VLLGLFVARPAPAQSSSRPSRALFGPTETDAARPQRFELTMSLYGAVDDNGRGDSDVVDATLQARRFFQGAQAGLTFSRRRSRSLITVQGSSALRYYSDLRRATGKHGGGISADVLASNRWRLQLSQSASYSPYYQLVLGRSASGLSFPDIRMTSPDYSVMREKVMTYGSFAGLTYTAGRRADVSLDFGLRYTDFFTGPDFNTRTLGGGITYQLSPDVGLVLGYRYGMDTQSAQTPIRSDNINVGVDYRRSLSFSPRTSFSVSSGSTVVSAEEGRRFQVTGAAALNHQISPRWTTRILYDRGLQLVETVPYPFLSSTITANLGGYVTPRISVSWVPTSSGGAAASSKAAYRSYSSQVQVNIALSRRWALYAEDFYYHYQFSGNADLPAILRAGLDRHGVRAGLTLWTPLNR